MAERAKHAFGMLENIDTALSNGTIDSYDILFVKDANGKPYVGWIDKEGNKVICDDAAEFAELEAKVATKVNADEVDAKIANALDNLELNVDAEVVEDYEVAYKPDGTLVDYRDKEIRIMCSTDTQWFLQNSGEGADPNAYYIGFKAYAPNDDVVSFKEDLAEIISDNEMYYFEGNDFAGIDENGKYSVVWLPVAKYDETNDAWTYYGANSSTEKFIGWYYSVEWYNADGKIVASDCIRINLSNEECHSYIKPFYMTDAVKTANEYTDAKIAEIAEASSYEIIEF